jgi:hypothetical protein
LRHYLQQSFLWFFVALLALHFIWFWWWMARRLLGKIKKGPSMQVRVWPFFASLSVYIVFIGFTAGQVIDPFKMLGQISWASLSIMISSYSFVIFTVIGLVQNIRYFKEDIHWFSRYFSLITCIVYTIVAAYFAYFGIIGLSTFA